MLLALYVQMHTCITVGVMLSVGGCKQHEAAQALLAAGTTWVVREDRNAHSTMFTMQTLRLLLTLHVRTCKHTVHTPSSPAISIPK